MGILIVFVFNVIVFILGVVLRLALYSAKITVSLLDKPIKKGINKAKRGIISKDSSTLLASSSLVVLTSLRALIALLTLLIIVIDILNLIVTTLGTLLGGIVLLLIFTVIVAGAYIIILNDCSVGGTSSNKTSQVSTTKDTGKIGSSETAGMGKLTEEAKSWAKSWEVTYIGDSLGAGSKDLFMGAFPNAIYEADPSRGLVSIKGQQTGETAQKTLERLISENKVKKNLVVAIGTNNDISTSALQNFYNTIPKSVETITWVLTASEGGVDNKSINSQIKNFVNSHDNMRYLDFKTYVDNNGGWGTYQGGDNIHMSQDGYSNYVNFQTQGLYDLYGGGTSSKSETSEVAEAFSFVTKTYELASSNVSKAWDMTVSAAEEKDKEKQGCNFTTTKVSDNVKSDSSNSSGGSLTADGTGSHGLNPVGWGIAYTPDELPDNLKKYAIDPESLGVKFGAPWEGGITGPNSSGWIDYVGVFGAEYAGQCTELSATMLYQLWEKDGNHILNVQGDGSQVVPIVASKLGVSSTNKPSTGAIFSTADSGAGHVGVVSHVFENGDVLIIEQNTPKSGMSAGKPNTWNYRLVSKSSISSEFNVGFVNPKDAGYNMVSKVKAKG